MAAEREFTQPRDHSLVNPCNCTWAGKFSSFANNSKLSLRESGNCRQFAKEKELQLATLHTRFPNMGVSYVLTLCVTLETAYMVHRYKVWALELISGLGCNIFYESRTSHRK